MLTKKIDTVRDLKNWYKNALAIYVYVAVSDNHAMYIRANKTDIKQQLFAMHDGTKLNAIYKYNDGCIGGSIYIG